MTGWCSTNTVTSQEFKKKDTHNDLEEKVLALERIQVNYPQESWIHVYTDGSADEATQNGGAGLYIQFPGGNEKRHYIPTGVYSSSFRAEAEAIRKGAYHFKKLLH